MPYRAALARATADRDKLARAQERNMTLLAAGAIGSADAQDNQSVLQAARAAQVSARYDLSSTRVRMPFEGVVLSKAVDVGATVAPGQPLATVADMGSSLIARAQVPAEVANRLQRGMAATVTMSGAAAAITGHMLRKGALSDTRTGTVEIDVALPAPHALVSGTVASVQFGKGAIRSATIPGSPAVQYIPAEALVDSHDGRGHVFIVDPRDKSAHLVAITVYGFDDDSLRISGLHDDARVITVGAGYVADGQKVTVLAR
jgi:RND family efflux transporter MFP subunit